MTVRAWSRRVTASDDGAIVGYGLAPGQIVLAWLVVEAPVDASQIACVGEALQGLIDGSAAAEVGKVAWCPDLVRTGRYPSE